MNTTIKIGVCLIVAAAVFFAIPALKGPINRLKNRTADALNDEFVVDNYRAEYIKLIENRKTVEDNLRKFNVELKIAQKKQCLADEEVQKSKLYLQSVGTDDLEKFNQAKIAYETLKTKYDNIVHTVIVYSNAVAKLNQSLMLIDMNKLKTKSNVDALIAKKDLVSTIKNVNSTLENLDGIGEDHGMALSLEKLDDTTLRESIKLDAMSEISLPNATMTKESAEEYLQSLN